MERTVAIGDIHGNIDKLKELFKKLSTKKFDTIVFLGDYIDRGKNSIDVIDWLIELSLIWNCVFLKGNHEQLFLNALKSLSEEDIDQCVINGGEETLKNYLLLKKNNFEKFKKHIKFFKSLKNYYLTEKFLFVHAGINPFKDWDSQDEEDFLWIRNDFIDSPVNIPQTVIFGHTIFDEPFVQKDKIGINLGCGIWDEDGKLAAYLCEENKFVIA